MKEIVYLRMKKNVEQQKYESLTLKDLAFISTTSLQKEELEKTPIYRVSKKDKNIVVIDSFLIIDHLNRLFPNIEIQLVGPPHTVVRINRTKKNASILLVSAVWLLLFIGAAMTIMNFHYDVSMQEVQQKLHYILTGKEEEFPLWIQIPYSLGLGLGMVLFFNHWFKKRINEEPSPLEVEIFNYQQNLDQYLTHYENRINDK
ncbi:stage V sporulation protein AA [Oceanobacillus halotolerans]|uniref:stage V sporulation protein AA n=1 Tax=Oceanobacillus halotolerans TaxID=2663380 RepID=UPI0013DA449B|nr:stage V sporulation protein AA [Oceanobacillus halotolerans]